MSDETVVMKTDGLDNLLKALLDQTSRVRVGILNSTTQRHAEYDTDEISGERFGSGQAENNNAEVGLKHEFGGPTTLPNGVVVDLPQRSFLRIPLIENFQRYLVNSKAFDRATLAFVLKEGKFEKFLAKMGAVGEHVVSDAFDSGGFGKWKPANMDFKENKQTLIESQQLRDSIISEVTSGD